MSSLYIPPHPQPLSYGLFCIFTGGLGTPNTTLSPRPSPIKGEGSIGKKFFSSIGDCVPKPR